MRQNILTEAQILCSNSGICCRHICHRAAERWCRIMSIYELWLSYGWLASSEAILTLPASGLSLRCQRWSIWARVAPNNKKRQSGFSGSCPRWNLEGQYINNCLACLHAWSFELNMSSMGHRQFIFICQLKHINSRRQVVVPLSSYCSCVYNGSR